MGRWLDATFRKLKSETGFFFSCSNPFLFQSFHQPRPRCHAAPGLVALQPFEQFVKDTNPLSAPHPPLTPPASGSRARASNPWEDCTYATCRHGVEVTSILAATPPAPPRGVRVMMLVLGLLEGVSFSCRPLASSADVVHPAKVRRTSLTHTRRFSSFLPTLVCELYPLHYRTITHHQPAWRS